MLDDASGFKAFLFRGQAVLPNSGGDNIRDFNVGDYTAVARPISMQS